MNKPQSNYNKKCREPLIWSDKAWASVMVKESRGCDIVERKFQTKLMVQTWHRVSGFVSKLFKRWKVLLYQSEIYHNHKKHVLRHKKCFCYENETKVKIYSLTFKKLRLRLKKCLSSEYFGEL